MKDNRKWILTTFMLTFTLALVFGGVSNLVVEKMNIIIATITLIIVIFSLWYLVVYLS